MVFSVAGCRGSRVPPTEVELKAMFAGRVTYPELVGRFGQPDSVEDRNGGVLFVTYRWYAPPKAGATQVYGLDCAISNNVVVHWRRLNVYSAAKPGSQGAYGHGHEAEVSLLYTPNGDARSFLRSHAGAIVTEVDVRKVTAFRAEVFTDSLEVDGLGLQPVFLSLRVEDAAAIIKGQLGVSNGVWVVASGGVIIGAADGIANVGDGVFRFTGVSSVMQKVWLR
jgi:hypothetical protein